MGCSAGEGLRIEREPELLLTERCDRLSGSKQLSRQGRGYRGDPFGPVTGVLSAGRAAGVRLESPGVRQGTKGHPRKF